jgi:hypothetical protein
MWLMAMGGIPLLVISLDVLTQRRITRWLTELLFRPEDIQIFEPRDVIFAWVMLLAGVLMVVIGLKELFVPTKVIECRRDGLAIRVNGPLRPPALIPWDNIRDVGGAEIDDDGEVMPLLVVTVFNREGIPENPWGARWVAGSELGVLSQDMDDDPQVIAERIADYAVETALNRGREESTGPRPEQ